MLVNGWVDTHAPFYPPADDSERTAQLELLKAAAWQLAEPPLLAKLPWPPAEARAVLPA
jgi:hypothetical protein